ncbi:MAG: glycosyltransferase family 2 protein [Halobacteriovoraceae bacterium]|nr:glycosyltransferase family 2 protein [Halobacteriovoraceae bacterium]
MLNDKKVAVVVPVYNEETQILNVIETMPDFVDRIVIINDCSTDNTKKTLEEVAEKSVSQVVLKKKKKKIVRSRYNEAEVILQKIEDKEDSLFTPQEIINKTPEDDRIIIINHLKNGGVGAAIASGYKWCRDHKIDCTAVMAGDGQMDPNELESICMPIINGEVDYVKGNRLIHRSAWLVIPKIRYFGNSVLSILTKIASGYWSVSDTQTGYTAISYKALRSIRIHKIYKRYGMPNDMLVKLNIAFCTVKEVEIKPVYRVGEQSKMKVGRVIPKISWLLFKLFFQRLWIKYFFRDFHPLFLLYNFSFILGSLSFWYGIKVVKKMYLSEVILDATVMAFSFFFIIGFQSLLFAMWMDIQDNMRLYRK